MTVQIENHEFQVMGHRGYGFEAPQNSREAFTKASLSGLSGIETDVIINTDFFNERFSPNYMPW